MEKLSGLVLDYYDDPEGTVLQTIDGGEDSVKTAHALSSEERDRLPDDIYALILCDGDVTLKKFAMADSGNTRLSVDYFFRTGHRLPAEAQKVAAANLLEGCRWFGITPPAELEKVAIGALGLLSAGLVVPGAVSEAKKNLQTVRGAGGAIMTPDQIKTTRQMGA